MDRDGDAVLRNRRGFVCPPTLHGNRSPPTASDATTSTSSTATTTTTDAPSVTGKTATVVSVTDGDTIRVLIGGAEEPLRLIGIAFHSR